MKYLTPESSTIEYIIITDDSKFYGFYHMKLKFKIRDELFDYEVKTKLWDEYFVNEIKNKKGLNIGKSIWCYILMGDIIEYISFNEIMKTK